MRSTAALSSRRSNRVVFVKRDRDRPRGAFYLNEELFEPACPEQCPGNACTVRQTGAPRVSGMSIDLLVNLLADARWIFGLAREPAANLAVKHLFQSFQSFKRCAEPVLSKVEGFKSLVSRGSFPVPNVQREE
jgi:hypothetical protein